MTVGKSTAKTFGLQNPEAKRIAEITLSSINGTHTVPHNIDVQTDSNYRVVAHNSGAERLASDVIVLRQGDDLHLFYADGQIVILRGFYAEGVEATVELPHGTNSSVILNKDIRGHAFSEGEILYAHGEGESLLELVMSQENSSEDLTQLVADTIAATEVATGDTAVAGGEGLLGQTSPQILGISAGLSAAAVAVAVVAGGGSGASGENSGGSVENSGGSEIVNSGFRIKGETAGDLSGYSVSSAGDVNGDGLDDLIIGATQANNATGKSYVVFGKTDGTDINLSDIAAGTGGFVINGATADDESGGSVSSVGDVNGDGFDDLIVGGMSTAYIVYGKATTEAVNLSSLGSDGFNLLQTQIFWLVNRVSAAGDVNGDGVDDFIVGSLDTTNSSSSSSPHGASYVVFGGNSNVDLPNLGANGFRITGETETEIGSPSNVSSAGDVNGDGLDDLIIGHSLADPTGATDGGKSYVVFGKSDNTDDVDLSNLNATDGFAINGEAAGDESGFWVSSAGDVNGDGLDDLIVSAYLADPNGKSNAGRSYVIFGTATGTEINLSDIASGSGGFAINGEAAEDLSGARVSAAGDVNGDGLDDIFVGAHFSSAGRSYVVYGKSDTTAIDLSDIASGSGGFVINRTAAEDTSGIVSAAGDVNGDGLADLIVGAQYASPDGKSGAGTSYVIFGKTDTNAVTPSGFGADSKHSIDYMGTPEDDTLTGTNAGEIFIGGVGNDTLTGGGGADVMRGGAGDDTFIVNASNLSDDNLNYNSSVNLLASINGGSGIDTVQFDGSGIISNLTVINDSRFQDIEIIDITGSGDNTLQLSISDVLDLSGMNLFNNGNGWSNLDASVSLHQLIIKGNSGDTVKFLSETWTSNTWSDTNDVTNDGQIYDVYEANNGVQVLIDQDISVIV